MITILDYGAGNLASLEGALDRMGFQHRRAERPDEIAEKGALILPGVGHFEAAQKALRARGWWSTLPHFVAEGRPLLGICLGLQLLAEGSEEAPRATGLGLLPGLVRRLGPGVKVPHMGWTQVRSTYAHAGVASLADTWLYFVHSYALDVGPETLGLATHGRPFTAVTARGRVLGFQPHPEKSGPAGLRLLKSALAWMGETTPSDLGTIQ